jgi:hypothetical protein
MLLCTVSCASPKSGEGIYATAETLFHADLVFHLLNYINLKDSPANLYSEDYISKFEEYKSDHGFESSLLKDAQNLDSAYKDYFNEVNIINFYAFDYSTYEDMVDNLKNDTRFSSAAKEKFIKPFISCMDKEKDIYKQYWDEEIKKNQKNIDSFLKYFNHNISPLENVFTYTNKKALLYLCVSLNNKGRGINIDDTLCAAIYLPKNEKQRAAGFYQAFHEMTHQFTDQFMFENISMEDGTKLLSEKIVMKTDYYLFQDAKDEYIQWDADSYGVSNATENDFLKFYELPDEYEGKIQDLLSAINSQ